MYSFEMFAVERTVLGLVIATLLVGCSHQFEVVNKSDFAGGRIRDDKHVGLNVALLVEPYKINDPKEQGQLLEYKMAKIPIPVTKQFLQDLAKSLNAQGGYRSFVAEDWDSVREADVVIRISEQVNGKSCGKNFWIGFPGCIIYAPAWNGYAYEVNWKFCVSLENPSTGLPMGDLILDRRLEVRYASDGEADGHYGNYNAGYLWMLVPLGPVFALIEASNNAGTYCVGTTLAARRTGALAVFVDGIAREIVAKINVEKDRLAKMGGGDE